VSTPTLASRRHPNYRRVSAVVGAALATVSVPLVVSTSIGHGTGGTALPAPSLSRENGWSTRTGGNIAAHLMLEARSGPPGDTTGAYENGWSTRTGGNLVSAKWRWGQP